jgi:hypothetical protein
MNYELVSVFMPNTCPISPIKMPLTAGGTTYEHPSSLAGRGCFCWVCQVQKIRAKRTKGGLLIEIQRDQLGVLLLSRSPYTFCTPYPVSPPLYLFARFAYTACQRVRVFKSFNYPGSTPSTPAFLLPARLSQTHPRETLRGASKPCIFAKCHWKCLLHF